jgi:hypothetical protein
MEMLVIPVRKEDPYKSGLSALLDAGFIVTPRTSISLAVMI